MERAVRVVGIDCAGKNLKCYKMKKKARVGYSTAI